MEGYPRRQLTRDLEGVARATAAVLVGGFREGSAVLVDQRHLLTADHLFRAPTLDGTVVESDEVEIVFKGDHGEELKTGASRVPLGVDAERIDIALLDLGTSPPSWLPFPVSMSPARRLPSQVRVLGYPLAEADLHGVWRTFNRSGPTGDRVQLDWVSANGTLPGHSGSPVVHPDTGLLVGVLVEGSEQGRFDRFVPLHSVRRVWRGLARPWLMAGLNERDHFVTRALGQRSRSRGGDLFRGRSEALREVRGRLSTPEGPLGPLVVTGEPGAGKSAVSGRACLLLEAEGVGPGLAFHARAATHDDFLSAIADLLGVEHAHSIDSMIESIGNQEEERWAIAVDALDEAASVSERAQIVATLNELAALPRVRVAVATRSLAVRNPYGPGRLLASLGIDSADSPNLVDLDSPEYFELAGLEQFAEAVLAQEGAEHPSPPGGAWTRYRSDRQLRHRLARLVARRADRNYLVVAMAAFPLSTRHEALDPRSAGFDGSMIPSQVGDALAKYLESLSESDSVQIRGLLTSLAYARGEGVDDGRWLQFAGALGYSAAPPDLDRLRDSMAADYLLETVRGNSGPITRLFHQALADELLVSRRRASDENALLGSLLPESAAGCWGDADAYARTYAAEHAVACGRLGELLDDPQFLAVSDLSRLLPLLVSAGGFGAIASVVRRAGWHAVDLPPTRRARLLALTAAHFGLDAIRRRMATVCDDNVVPRWAHTMGAPHQEIVHASWVRAVAVERVADRAVIISGTGDGAVRTWDAASGEQVNWMHGGSAPGVWAVGVADLGRREIVLAGREGEAVQCWDAASGGQVRVASIGHAAPLTAIAIGRVGERTVLVSGSSAGEVRIWDATRGARTIVAARSMAADRREIWGVGLPGEVEQEASRVTAINAIAVGHILGEDVIVTGGLDAVRMWDARSGGTLGPALRSAGHWVTAVAVGRTDETEIVAYGSSDGSVWIWDATSGDHVLSRPDAPATAVRALTLGSVDGRGVVVVGGDDGTVRILDPVSGMPEGVPMGGHSAAVRALALGKAAEREIIASGSDDGRVRIWEVGGEYSGVPLPGHSQEVTGLTVGRVGGQDVVVSAAAYHTVRMWDSVAGETVGHRLLEARGVVVRSLATGTVMGRAVIVCGDTDGIIRILDPESGESMPAPVSGQLAAHKVHGVNASGIVAVGTVGGRGVIVAGRQDGKVRLWDAETLEQFRPMVGHEAAVTALALGSVGGQDVVVSGSTDGTIRTWDAESRVRFIVSLSRHAGWVGGVALARVDGREAIVAGTRDGKLRIFDAIGGEQLGDAVSGHTAGVTALCLVRVNGQEFVVSGSDDGTVRIWDMCNRNAIVIDLLERVGGIAGSPRQLLFVAAGSAISAFELSGLAGHRFS